MANETKKVLVTGGAGFIGSNLIKRLLDLGYFVRTIDNFFTGQKENIKEFSDHKQFEFIQGDMRDKNTCKQALEGIDCVFHLAAIPSVPRSIKDPIASNDANVVATLNLLVAAKENGKIKKLVYSSSSSIYGDTVKLPKEENDPIGPISPYAISKYAGERYCQVFSKIYGLPTICLRYFNVFGPKQNPISQYGAVIPKFIFSIIQNKRPIIYGDGEQTRDFTYVDNVVEANILAANSDISGEVINIACNQRISVNRIMKLINEFLNTEIKPVYEARRAGDILHSLADISKAEKLLNYKPKVYFEDGLEKTVKWFQESGILEIAGHFTSIRFAKEKDIEQISRIYKEKIRTGFLSSLGLSFLTLLYEAIIKSVYGICIVAEIDNKVVGFAAGTSNINKLYWHFLKRNFMRALPVIFLKILNLKRFKKALETLFYPKKKKGSSAELFVVELDEEIKEVELKELLFQNFIAEMKKNNVRIVKTVAHESFKETIDFYKKVGFEFYKPIEIHKGDYSGVYLYEIK